MFDVQVLVAPSLRTCEKDTTRAIVQQGQKYHISKIPKEPSKGVLLYFAHKPDN